MLPYKYAPWRWPRNWVDDKTGIIYPKNFKNRALYGVSIEDVWSFDNYLSKVIARGIKILRKQGNGHPCYIYGESGEEIYSMSYDSELEKEVGTGNGPKIWDDVLETIIAGFEAYDLLMNDHTWWPDKKKREHFEGVFNKGFRLFMYNFRGLWW